MDVLRGFKENVITGHLIPAGTGAEKFQNLHMTKLGEEIPIELPPPKPEHKEEKIEDIDFGDEDEEVDEIFSDKIMDEDEDFIGKQETDEFLDDDYEDEKSGVFDDEIDESEFDPSKDYENEND